jgi:large subunit ribosomal protein L15
MQLHQLQPKTIRKTVKRVGRGGKRGKTSGKGGKGQTARAGSRPRPEMRDIIKRLPKLRGFGKNRARTVNGDKMLPVVVNLKTIESLFEAGDTVSPQTLIAKKAVSIARGKAPQIKILGTGDLTKKITLSGCVFSASVKAKIEKAGGQVL